MADDQVDVFSLRRAGGRGVVPRHRVLLRSAGIGASRSRGPTRPAPAAGRAAGRCPPVGRPVGGAGALSRALRRRRADGRAAQQSRLSAARPDANGLRDLFGETPTGPDGIRRNAAGAVQLGAEEARRRTRYAVLAGLNAEGYIPDDSEHMRLMRVRRCERFAECAEKEGVGSFLARGRPRGMDGPAAAEVDQRRVGEIQETRNRHDRPRLRDIDIARDRRGRSAPQRRRAVDRRHNRRQALAEHARHAACRRGADRRRRAIAHSRARRVGRSRRRPGRRPRQPAEGSGKPRFVGGGSELPQKLANSRQAAADQRRVDGAGRNCAGRRGCLPVRRRGKARTKIASRKRFAIGCTASAARCTTRAAQGRASRPPDNLSFGRLPPTTC